jgi:phosphatidylglycerophosphatase A
MRPLLSSSDLTDRQAPTFRALFKYPVLFLGFGLGSGLLPKGPGTWGTLVGMLMFLPLAVFAPLWGWAVTVVGLLAGSYVCGRSAELVGVHDHGGIVWDEFVAIWLVLLCLPEQTPFYWFLAFILFRVFDIFKPYPIQKIDEKVSGGFGIMLDDIIAALYSIGIIWGISSVNFIKIG